MAANRKRHIRQSETAEILRSQINMNPFNPKRHSEEKVLEQKRNFMRVGFMGLYKTIGFPIRGVAVFEHSGATYTAVDHGITFA